MRLLLDTHALLWWAHEPAKLSSNVFDAIKDGENDVVVSAVSAMEIATKHRKGRLEYRTTLADRFVSDVTSHGFDLLAVTSEHAQQAGGYGGENQDPWDRLLAAQAQIENLALVSRDTRMSPFGAKLFW